MKHGSLEASLVLFRTIICTCTDNCQGAIKFHNYGAIKVSSLFRLASGSNLTLESRMGFPSDLPNVVVGFQAAISCFVAEANDDPKPFTWLADPNKSIVAVRRGYQVLDSIH